MTCVSGWVSDDDNQRLAWSYTKAFWMLIAKKQPHHVPVLGAAPVPHASHLQNLGKTNQGDP
jgi:hypothetical protein